MYKMHVVIGGCGRVGRYLAHMLSYEGHSVGIIDKDELSFEELKPDFAGTKVVGMVFDREALERAGIQRADAYVAVTSGDNSNIVSARIAKEHYRVPRVFARIYDPRRAEIYQNFGIPTVASVSWASSRLLNLISHPELHSDYQFGNGEVELIELALPLAMEGRKVRDLEVPGEIRVSSIVRGHRAFIPLPDTEFDSQDRLYISVARESLSKLERLLGLK